MEIKFVPLEPGCKIPACQTPGSAGYDLSACLTEPLILPPGEMRMVPLGFAAEIPAGFAGFVFSRSGMGARGIVVAQGVGVIDSDYRGGWMVPLRNLSGEEYAVQPGERIAQVIFMRAEQAKFVRAEALSETARGEGGFGSTSRGGY